MGADVAEGCGFKSTDTQDSPPACVQMPSLQGRVTPHLQHSLVVRHPGPRNLRVLRDGDDVQLLWLQQHRLPVPLRDTRLEKLLLCMEAGGVVVGNERILEGPQGGALRKLGSL
jgi:hypothetical protein